MPDPASLPQPRRADLEHRLYADLLIVLAGARMLGAPVTSSRKRAHSAVHGLLEQELRRGVERYFTQGPDGALYSPFDTIPDLLPKATTDEERAVRDLLHSEAVKGAEYLHKEARANAKGATAYTPAGVAHQNRAFVWLGLESAEGVAVPWDAMAAIMGEAEPRLGAADRLDDVATWLDVARGALRVDAGDLPARSQNQKQLLRFLTTWGGAGTVKRRTCQHVLGVTTQQLRKHLSGLLESKLPVREVMDLLGLPHVLPYDGGPALSATIDGHTLRLWPFPSPLLPPWDVGEQDTWYATLSLAAFTREAIVAGSVEVDWGVFDAVLKSKGFQTEGGLADCCPDLHVAHHHGHILGARYVISPR